MSTIPQNTTLLNSLLELGLSQNEAQLYEILLRTPKANIAELQQKSPFSRTMIYYIINQLKAWELVREEKEGKKTIYVVEPPEKLEEVLESQQEEMKRRKSIFTEMLPSLQSMYRLSHNQPGVKFFEGKEGVQAVLQDSLTTKTEIYSYADIENIQKYIGDINAEYVKKRNELGIRKKGFAIDNIFTRNFLKDYYPTITETKLISAIGVPLFHTVMQIYDGKISYITLSEKSMIGVIVEDPNIYSMHKYLFEHLWSLTPELQRSVRSNPVISV